jgi:hypothetical protein
MVHSSGDGRTTRVRVRWARVVAFCAAWAAVTAVGLADADAASSGVLVTPTSIGSLTLGRSTRHDVRAAYGVPVPLDTHSSAYACTGQGLATSCRITFSFGERGQFRGRLLGAVLGTREHGFHTLEGVTIGMSIAKVRNLQPPLYAGDVCGDYMLRYAMPAGAAGDLNGLTMFVTHGKIAAFFIMSPRERIVCKDHAFVIG